MNFKPAAVTTLVDSDITPVSTV